MNPTRGQQLRQINGQLRTMQDIFAEDERDLSEYEDALNDALSTLDKLQSLFADGFDEDDAYQSREYCRRLGQHTVRLLERAKNLFGQENTDSKRERKRNRFLEELRINVLDPPGANPCNEDFAPQYMIPVHKCAGCGQEIQMDLLGAPAKNNCPECQRKLGDKQFLTLANTSDWSGFGKGRDGHQKEHLTIASFELRGQVYRWKEKEDRSFKSFATQFCNFLYNQDSFRFKRATKSRSCSSISPHVATNWKGQKRSARTSGLGRRWGATN